MPGLLHQYRRSKLIKALDKIHPQGQQSCRPLHILQTNLQSISRQSKRLNHLALGCFGTLIQKGVTLGCSSLNKCLPLTSPTRIHTSA